MKKLFFLAAAVLASFSLFAETENSPASATKDKDIVGESYTFDNTLNAGAGGIQVSPMPNKGIKMRINKPATTDDTKTNAIEFKVNEGCAINGIKLVGVTNSDNKAATLGDIYVDGVKYAGTYDKNLPAKNASAASDIEISGLNATKAIIFTIADLNGNTQANISYVVTYTVTAVKYNVTYKANYGDVKDITESALKVKDNPFALPENKYFAGWNTAADGTGTAVAVGSALTADVTLYAQWKAFTAEATMEVDSGTVKPAKDVEVALKEGSKGGKMYFAGAKDGDYEASFIYKKGGSVQLSKGGADSIRVELDGALKAGSVVCLELIAASDGAPALNIVAGGKTIAFVSNIEVKEKDTVSVYYTVVAEDGLAGAKKFCLQRGASTVIFNALSIEGMEEAAPEEKSSDASIKSMEINKTAVTEKDGVFAYEVAADENLAKVKVEFVLADKATADKTSPLEIDVPAAGATAEETINVTAEDGVTKKAYKISITKAKKAEEALEDVTDGQKIMKSFENGQLVIIKNGVKYNAAGAVVR